jgi:hypothetical protein
MEELVVAYSEADEDAAGLLIVKLEEMGCKVTRRRSGPGAARLRRRQLEAGGHAPVVVLWSQDFARIRAAGRPRRALMAVRLDDAQPSPLLKAPAVDLRGWRGREDHRGWRKLAAAVGGAAAPSGRARSRPSPKAGPAKKKAGAGAAVLWMLATATAALGAAGAWMLIH